MYRESAKNVLVRVLFDMMTERNIDDITVTEILKKSGMSKATFYRNFSDKYELMAYCYSTNIDRYIEDIDLVLVDYKIILEKMFDFYIENRNFMRNGFKSTDFNSLDSFLYRYTVDFYQKVYKEKLGKDYLTRKEKCAISFNTAGSIKILGEWINNRMPGTAAEEAQMHYDFMPDALKRIFENK